MAWLIKSSQATPRDGVDFERQKGVSRREIRSKPNINNERADTHGTGPEDHKQTDSCKGREMSRNGDNGLEGPIANQNNASPLACPIFRKRLDPGTEI